MYLFLVALFWCRRIAGPNTQYYITLMTLPANFLMGGVALSGSTLFGMTNEGGASESGVIYSIQTDGSGYTDLHEFNGTDGDLPYGTIIVSGSTLYGMTFNGGGSFGYGVIFSMQTDGSNFTDLYTFDYGQGGLPYGSIILSGDTIFGMTTYGGADNNGIVFSIQTDGSAYTDLHDFNGTQGEAPYYNSLTVSGNTLYGMTPSGGAHNAGIIFSMQTNGNNFTDLHDFNNTQGASPQGSLILSGNTLYGMTGGGGAYGYGIIFSMQTDGTDFIDRHDFNELQGSGPLGSLTLSGSTLYGMTEFGGANASGIIFTTDTNGNNFMDLLDFTDARGAWPWDNLIISGSSLYGTTAGGGIYYDGSVFKFSIPGLSVEQLPMSAQSVTLYPNPNNGNFKVCSGVNSKATMQVHNLLGEQVYSASLNMVQGGRNEVNIGSQPSGIYLYKIVSDEGSLIGEGKLEIDK